MASKGLSRSQKRRKLYEAQKHKCLFCGRFCKFKGKGGERMLFTNEHVVPLYFGGTRMGNIVGACLECNQGRAKVIQESPRAEHKSIFISRFKEQQRFKAQKRTYTCLS